jgi:hypothetical protein
MNPVRLNFPLPPAPRVGELPVVPVGLDAYRQWDRWARQRIGVRAHMRSTYDRTGGNERADASHFLYLLPGDVCVPLHVEGRGVLYFARYNHWHGSPWTYEVDDTKHVVKETSTGAPWTVQESKFIPEALFPEPLALTWSTTHGANLMWVPIPFERSFRMGYGHSFYGTGYYIYHHFADGVPLSQPVRAWDGATPPGADVLQLLGRSATELLPARDSAEERAAGIVRQEGEVALLAGDTKELAALAGAGELRALEFSAPRASALACGRLRLRVTWDDAPHASIDAPLALFFGAGTLHNRDHREYLVRAFPMQIRFDAERVHLACVFPMPFARSARVELENPTAVAVTGIRWALRVAPLREPFEQAGHFHATYRDHANPTEGEDLVLLDTRQVEGGGDWSGSFVGTSLIFTHAGNLRTLEGDPRFFFDDSQTPQAQGTGTEEWGGGGDYWGGRNMTLPLAGHPCGVRKAEDAQAPEDLIHSAYRFLLADLMPFGKRAVIQLEHGEDNTSKEHYETVTYWYGRNRATLVLSDRLKVGDPASEQEHGYQSPTASAVYHLDSRYEWGPDTIAGRTIFPAERDGGRVMTGVSEFQLKVDPANVGVLLRRKLDYGFPNQRAEVEIAKVRAGVAGAYQPAGAWFLAGSNTCVFSYPKQELDPPLPVLQTSNRRFRDDEFLVGRALTEGAEAIRVRVKFTPVGLPLLPGLPAGPLGWSELRYDAYSILPPHG